MDGWVIEWLEINKNAGLVVKPTPARGAEDALLAFCRETDRVLVDQVA